MQSKFNSLIGQTLAGLAIAATTSSAIAATLYDSASFEKPRFAVGDLTGQSGWGESADAQTSAQVTTFSDNTQGVLVTRIANSDHGYFAPPITYSYSSTPTQNVVNTSWDEYIVGGANDNAFFGMEAYDGATPVATAGFDATNGALTSRDPSTFFAEYPTAFTALPNTFYHLTLSMNFQTQKFTIFVNNTAVETLNFENATNELTDIDITTSSTTANNSTTQSEYAYYDNYIVTTVPEPATLSVLSLGGLSLLRRRRA